MLHEPRRGSGRRRSGTPRDRSPSHSGSRCRRSCRRPAGLRSASSRSTRRISPVAVCCSSDSVSSRFRAPSSVNSRTFSIAITAWSAKVLTSSICSVRELRHSAPRDRDAPRPCGPFRSIGTVRSASIADRARQLSGRRRYVRVASTSRTWITRRSSTDRAVICSGPGGHRVDTLGDRQSLHRPGSRCATRWIRSPSNERRRAEHGISAAGSRAPRMESNTGCMSVGELEMTRRISAVAVCCSSDSVSSRFAPRAP